MNTLMNHHLALRVDAAVRAVCPIDGVSIRSPDKETWSVQFREEATEAERTAAAGVISTFDFDAAVPASITPYQARRALNAAGLRDAAEAAIAAASQDVRDAWEYALTIERRSPFIEAIGSALGLTEQQIDSLFVAAAT